VSNSESRFKPTDSAWLEKFKQKNNLLDAKPKKDHSCDSPVSSDWGEMVSSTTSPNQNYDGFGTCGSDDTDPFPAPGQNHRNTSPVSSLGPPTQDDAGRALDQVWSYFQNQPVGILEPGECVTIGKLMAHLSHNPGRSPID
jgi:hypothetical protein